MALWLGMAEFGWGWLVMAEYMGEHMVEYMAEYGLGYGEYGCVSKPYSDTIYKQISKENGKRQRPRNTIKNELRNFGATIRLSIDEYGCVRLYGMTESCWVWLRIAEYD